MKRKSSRFDRLLLPTLATACVGLVTSQAGAVVLYSTPGSTYTEDFSGLASSGSTQPWANDSTINGWSTVWQNGTAVTTLNVSTGTNNAGAFYNFGAANSSDRALGSLGSNSFAASGNIAGWIAVAIQNTTGSTINEVNVAYDGEQWRNGGNTASQTMVVEHGIGASFNTVASWTATGASFDFTSPVATSSAAALDGNVAANRVAGLGGTVSSLNWNNGDTLWFRFVERNDSGNDHGLAVDNFSFSTTALPPPPPPPVDAVLPTVGNTLTFDFSDFTGAGFASAPATGQLDSDNFIVTGLNDGPMTYGDTRATGDFARGASAGNVITGGVYAFDHGGGDVGLGIQPAGSDFTPGTIDLRLQNTTGSLINDLLVEFEVWVLNNEDRSNLFAFSYSTDGIAFIAVPSAEVTSPAGATVLTAPVWTLNPFSVSLSALGLADGDFLFLRWTGDDVGGVLSRDEFALDNINITNRASVAVVPEPVTFTMLALGGIVLMNRRQRTA